MYIQHIYWFVVRYSCLCVTPWNYLKIEIRSKYMALDLLYYVDFCLCVAYNQFGSWSVYIFAHIVFNLNTIFIGSGRTFIKSSLSLPVAAFLVTFFSICTINFLLKNKWIIYYLIANNPKRWWWWWSDEIKSKTFNIHCSQLV